MTADLPTPRTDAQEKYRVSIRRLGELPLEVVSADFARTLERELATQEGYPGIAHDFEQVKADLPTPTTSTESSAATHVLAAAEALPSAALNTMSDTPRMIAARDKYRTDGDLRFREIWLAACQLERALRALAQDVYQVARHSYWVRGGGEKEFMKQWKCTDPEGFAKWITAMAALRE